VELNKRSVELNKRSVGAENEEEIQQLKGKRYGHGC
jgi:hypothetical protein